MKLFRLLAVMVVLAMVTGSAWAQLTSATIVGTVTDTTGAVVPGATVTATNVDTHFSRSAVTSGSGAYRLEFLPIGKYIVVTTAKGFNSVKQENVTLNLNAELNLSPALAAGVSNTEITVTDAPPMVQTTSSSVGRIIQSAEIDNLPLVNRDPYTLIQLTPGVQSYTSTAVPGAAAPALGLPQYTIYVNGSLDDEIGSVSFYLDGGSNMTFLRNQGNVLPNPDALQEMNVITNGFNALYGRSSSAIVNTVTKSGTNQIHGSIFEFFRSDKLNAFPYGVSAATGKSRLHQNQFGATLGGPFKIPGLYNGHDKTFFFGSYAGLRRYANSLSNNVHVITPLEKASIIAGQPSLADRLPSPAPANCTQPTGASASLGQVVLCTPVHTILGTGVANDYSNTASLLADKDTANTPIAGNVMTTAFLANHPLDPAAVNILTNFLPTTIPGLVDAGGEPIWAGYFSTPQVADEYLIKVDHNLTPRQRVEAMYYQSIGSVTAIPGGSNLPAFWSHSFYPYRQQNANLSHTWTLNDRQTNQIWLTYSRMIGGRDNLSPSGTSIGLDDLGSDFHTIGVRSLPQITTTAYFTLGEAISGPLAGTNYYGLRDVFSWTKGKHTLAFGAEANLEKDMQNTTLNNYGVFSFALVGTGATCTRTCNALGDLLLGLENGTATGGAGQDAGVYALDNTWLYGFFAQDDWKILPRLTLNLGLRWDIQTPPTDPQNRESAWVPGRQSVTIPSLPAGLLVVGDPGLTRGVVSTRLGHVSPRIGFAWDVFGTGKTSVRGAGGIFYGIVSGNEWNATSNFVPYANRIASFAPANMYTLSHPYVKFPGGISPLAGFATYNPATFVYNNAITNQLEGFDPNYKWPYSYQFNLSVQQQFTKDFAVTISYIGNLSHGVPFDTNANPLCTGNMLVGATNCQSIASGNSRRPLYNPATFNISNIFVIASGQSGHYHALQIDFEKRLSQHFSVHGFYVWSRTMESANLQQTTNQATAPQNFLNFREDYGRSDDDARNRSVTSVVWKPDYFTHFDRAVRLIGNGWTIAATITLRSGNPFSVSNTDANNGNGGAARASVVPGVSPYNTTAVGHKAKSAPGGYLNIAAFCTPNSTLATVGSCAGYGPNTGQFFLDGNSPRDGFVGPGYKNVDMSLFRNFQIYGRTQFQFRAEATNAFNFVNLNNPTAAFNTVGTFGGIGGAGGMRVMQLGARLVF